MRVLVRIGYEIPEGPLVLGDVISMAQFSRIAISAQLINCSAGPIPVPHPVSSHPQLLPAMTGEHNETIVQKKHHTFSIRRRKVGYY